MPRECAGVPFGAEMFLTGVCPRSCEVCWRGGHLGAVLADGGYGLRDRALAARRRLSAISEYKTERIFSANECI